MATGRTTSKRLTFIVNDSGSTLREVPIFTINGVGIVYDEVDPMALQDAMHGALSGHGNAPIDLTGPFSNLAAAAVGALSGSHTVLEPLNGLLTPLTVDVQIGIQSAWSSGDPQFGITATAANGYIVTSYTMNPADMTYAASLRLFPGSAAPAWGTAAET